VEKATRFFRLLCAMLMAFKAGMDLSKAIRDQTRELEEEHGEEAGEATSAFTGMAMPDLGKIFANAQEAVNRAAKTAAERANAGRDRTESRDD
jgi:hypothetical protein